MMLKILTMALFSLALTNCGSSDLNHTNANSYSVSNELALNGSIKLSFEEAYNFRSISVGKPQAIRCNIFADHYMQNNKIAVAKESLKLSHSEPRKHCLKRDVLKNCESYEYIYSFTCHYQGS